MRATSVTDDLLGGVGLTYLRVYDQRPAPDGTMSGCAHVHAVTDEAYFVVSGTGFLELHDLEHGFRRVPLVKGVYTQFTPGTVHRSVSTGSLEILAIMGNAGLAERGDARIWFGPGVDDDPVTFERLVALPRERGLDGALERRDASVAAYAQLLRLFESDRRAYERELERFVQLHRTAMATRSDELVDVIRSGPGRWLEQALARVAALPGTGDDPVAQLTETAGAPTQLGMCGLLRQVARLAPL